jgi:hypothetical protein
MSRRMGLCLLGHALHKVEIGHDRGLLRIDVLGVKKKTIKDSPNRLGTPHGHW